MAKKYCSGFVPLNIGIFQFAMLVLEATRRPRLRSAPLIAPPLGLKVMLAAKVLQASRQPLGTRSTSPEPTAGGQGLNDGQTLRSSGLPWKTIGKPQENPGKCWFSMGFWMDDLSSGNDVYIANWKITLLNGNIHHKWQCAIATLNYRRVYSMAHD